MFLDVFPFGHPNLPTADHVHELDGDERLRDGRQNEPGKLHGFIEVLLTADNLTDLLAGHAGVSLGMHSVTHKGDCQTGRQKDTYLCPTFD